MNNLIKSAFEKMPLPSVEEVARQAREEPVLFPDAGAVTEEWIRLSQSYMVLFGKWFLKETGLDRLDERVSAEGIRPASEEQKGFYQKYDRLGLRYFYLRCWARIERLEGDEPELLKKYLEEEPGEEADAFLERTFAAVMAVCPEEPYTVFEPKMTLHRDYSVEGEQIPLVMRTVADFAPDGSL
nr:hypothetical protein [Clostridium sp.]